MHRSKERARAKSKRPFSGGSSVVNTLGSNKSSSPAPSPAKDFPIYSDKNFILGKPSRLTTAKTSLEFQEFRRKADDKRDDIQKKFTEIAGSSDIVQYRFGNILNNNSKVLRTYKNDHHEKALSDSENEFSDIASNNVVIKKSKDFKLVKKQVLSIDEYDADLHIPTDYSFIRFPCEKVSLGQNKIIERNNGQNELRLVVSTDLSHLEIQCKEKNEDLDVIAHLDFHEDIQDIWASNESILFKLNQSVKSNTRMTFFNLLTVYGSSSNIKKLRMAWNQIPGALVNHEMQVKTSDSIESEISKNGANRFDSLSKVESFTNKKFTSLNKKGSGHRGTTIQRPSTPLKTDEKQKSKSPTQVSIIPLFNATNSAPASASSATGPSDPKSFYTPSKFTPSRITRSHTKTSDTEILSSSQHITIDDPVSTRKKNPKIIYKPSLKFKFRDNSVMRIKNNDFACLYGSRWINDILIDFFVKYLTETPSSNRLFPRENNPLIEPQDTLNLQVLSTFFFNKLKSSTNYYENIKKWISKIPLFEKKFLILPINESLHWYCIIIHNLTSLLPNPITTAVAAAANDDNKSDASVEITEELPYCTIYVLDSLAQHHDDLLIPIRSFIKGYAKDTHGVEIKDEQVRLKIGRVPKQPNFNDCGVHVIYNVMKFISHEDQIVRLWERVDDELDSKDVTSLGGGKSSDGKTLRKSSHVSSVWSRESPGLFLKTERAKMRERLRWLLLELQKEQIARGDVSSDEDGNNDEGEDDVMYIDADEFHASKKNSNNNTEENSKEVSEDNEEEEEGDGDDDEEEEHISDVEKNKKKKKVKSESVHGKQEQGEREAVVEADDEEDEIITDLPLKQMNIDSKQDIEEEEESLKITSSPPPTKISSSSSLVFSQPELIGVEVAATSEEPSQNETFFNHEEDDVKCIEIDPDEKKNNMRKYETFDSDVESITSDSSSRKKTKH